MNAKRTLEPVYLAEDQTTKLIEEGRRAEACRDIDLLKEILQPIWPDIEEDPVLPEMDLAGKAEILRLAGFFLGYYGHIKGKADYQERGKDLLSNAVDLFETAGLEEEAARARLNLAWRYYQQGSFDESEAILEYTKGQFESRPSTPTYLRLKIFESVTATARSDFDSACDSLKDIASKVEKSDDPSIRAQFHIEAGYVCTEKNQLPNAISHYEKALNDVKELRNDRYRAIILGNLAFVLTKQRLYERAYTQIEKAISLNLKSQQSGFLAHNYDTKAQILLHQNDAGRALQAINTSIGYFSEGEDYSGLADAMFNKVRILLKLQESEEALALFASLIDLAKTRINESAARKYARRFDRLIFYPTGGGYKTEVAEFKKFILREALTNANHVMKDAAAELHISQAMLSDILRRQFPEIFDELGIKKRKSRKMS